MLPKDPMMLLSFVNTKLRDEFSSLEAFCEDAAITREELTQTLAQIDYEYDEALNRFV